LKKPLTKRYPIPFAIYADVTQFIVVALLLSILLEWLLGYRVLSPSRFATIGAIFGVMKSVARAFNQEWKTQLPIWKRVTDEHFISLCFVIALPLAGQWSPSTLDLGTIKIKKPPIAKEVVNLTWKQKVNQFNFETISASSYSIRESNAWVLLLCSLAIEALIVGGKNCFVAIWRRQNAGKSTA